MGWRDGSEIKSAWCSCRGPEFDSQHPRSSSQPLVTPVPVFWSTQTPGMDTVHVHTHMQQYTHPLFSNNANPTLQKHLFFSYQNGRSLSLITYWLESHSSGCVGREVLAKPLGKTLGSMDSCAHSLCLRSSALDTHHVA